MMLDEFDSLKSNRGQGTPNDIILGNEEDGIQVVDSNQHILSNIQSNQTDKNNFSSAQMSGLAEQMNVKMASINLHTFGMTSQT
mmetsp:Transcript_42364/g.40608  ORF Transcript_42364/g.40608 Transcript_42364/m.40608 type:complete len:84 (-) Transcript_42364:1433-1684(-)